MNAQALVDKKSAAKASRAKIELATRWPRPSLDLEGQLEATRPRRSGPASGATANSSRPRVADRRARPAAPGARSLDQGSTPRWPIRRRRTPSAAWSPCSTGSLRGPIKTRESIALLLAAAALVAAFADSRRGGGCPPRAAWVLPFALIVFTAANEGGRERDDAGAARASAARFRSSISRMEGIAWWPDAVRQQGRPRRGLGKAPGRREIAGVRKMLMADLEVLKKRDEEQASRLEGLQEGLGIGDESGVEASLLVDAVKRAATCAGSERRSPAHRQRWRPPPAPSSAH